MAQILQVNVIEIKNNGHFTPVSVHVTTFCWRRTTLIPEYPQRTTFMLEYPQRTTLMPVNPQRSTIIPEYPQITNIMAENH
jgi:hypothetical protein